MQSAAPDGTSLTVSPPVRDATGPVTVTVTNVFEGQQRSASAVAGYTYSLAPATVTGLSTTSAIPGTPVTVTGTSFVGVTAVRFGSTPVPFTWLNGTTLYATAPVTPTGAHGTSQQVVVVNGTGTASTGGPSWTWDSRPAITAMSSNDGVAGSTLTLTGTGFTGATSVQFGSVTGTITGGTATTLTVTVPTTPSAGTTTNVSVTTPSGTSPEPPTGSLNDWTWAPIAAVNVLSPATAGQGTTVTVTGRNFTPGLQVWVEADPENTFPAVATYVSPTTFTFVVPPRPGGTLKDGPKRLVVVNSSGSVNKVDVGGSNIFRWA